MECKLATGTAAFLNLISLRTDNGGDDPYWAVVVLLLLLYNACISSMKTFAIAFASLVTVSIVSAQELPAGPGKDTVEKVCTACHGVEAIVALQGGKDIWQGIVDDMKGRGADGSADDFKTIVNYLSKYFGNNVNVNTASAQELADLDLTTDEAAAIVKYRTDNGNFKEFADLKKVPGLDASKLEPIQKRIKF
jgi:competence protein ComEA